MITPGGERRLIGICLPELDERTGHFTYAGGGHARRKFVTVPGGTVRVTTAASLKSPSSPPFFFVMDFESLNFLDRRRLAEKRMTGGW